MRFRVSSIVASVLMASAATASAARWTSPDGAIGIDLPDDGSMVAVPNPPAPATAMWVTKTAAARLAFIEQPMPADARVDVAGLEEGTRQPFNGTVLSSTQASIKGATVYTIAVQGTAGTNTVFATQRIVMFGGKAYKLMAAAGDSLANHAEVSAAMDSLAILVTPPPAPAIALPALDSHRASVNIAEIGWLVLFLAGIIVFVRRQLAKPSIAPAPPPPIDSGTNGPRDGA